MQPSVPSPSARDAEPNVELLRRTGWSVGVSAGDYCVAWRGRDEAVFEWRSGGWHQIGGRGSPDGL
ncbi:MAG: hypothetical protein C0501_02135 [Isosphaera sp.]|nr:hypothetical protein [Isosphaera sp.]